MSPSSIQIGMRFGRLVVVCRVIRAGESGQRWRCQCDCGGSKVALAGNLWYGGTKSCGCLLSPPLADRLWAKVHIGGSDDCWPWTGAVSKDGYGYIQIRPGKRKTVHRVAYELVNECELPSHIDVMHSCDNPPCCNPAHLSAGTRLANVLDMASKGRGWWQREAA